MDEISKFYKNHEKEKIKNKKGNEKDKKNYLVSFFNKCLLSFILVIISLIVIKVNPSFKDILKENVYQDNLSFAYLNNLYNKYFGSILPSYSTEEVNPVFDEKLTYTSYTNFYDGYELTVSKNYLVPIIESGIVVFMGDIENYGYTIIIEGVDGVDIWYSNIKNPSVNLYDYVKSGNYLGEVEGEHLYLVFEKGKKYLTFEEYFKN